MLLLSLHTCRVSHAVLIFLSLSLLSARAQAYYFEQTILAGGAKYRPTGRGFVTRHEDFSEIYRFHASSHFYRAMEMVFLLSFYSIVIPWGFSYGLVTWPAWLIVVSWLFAPFWFNPLAFQWEKMVEDVGHFLDWMNRKEGDGDRSWKAWWREEIAFLNDLNLERRLVVSVIACRHAVVGYALLHYVHASKTELSIGAAIIITAVLSLVIAQAKFGHKFQFSVRALKAIIFFAFVGLAWYYWHLYSVTSGVLFNSGVVLIGLMYFLSTITTVLLTMGVRHRFLVRYYKVVDFVIASVLLSIIALFSITVIPSIIQTRLMFHNAFSRGVMIDKLLRMQQESKDTTPNTAPSGSAPTATGASFRGDPNDPSRPQFDFASIGFIEKRSRSRLNLHQEEEKAEGGSRSRKGSAEHRDRPHNGGSNNGYTAEKEGGKKGREEGAGKTVPIQHALPGAGRRVPSYSSLSKLAEGDEDTTPTHQVATTLPAPGFSAAGRGGPMSISTGTLSPLVISPSSTTPGSAPIPPTVAPPAAGGMPIPKTISVAEYQSGLGAGGSGGGGQPKSGRVKGMAQSIDERAVAEKKGDVTPPGASSSVGMGLGTGLQPRR